MKGTEREKIPSSCSNTNSTQTHTPVQKFSFARLWMIVFLFFSSSSSDLQMKRRPLIIFVCIQDYHPKIDTSRKPEHDDRQRCTRSWWKNHLIYRRELRQGRCRNYCPENQTGKRTIPSIFRLTNLIDLLFSGESWSFRHFDDHHR